MAPAPLPLVRNRPPPALLRCQCGGDVGGACAYEGGPRGTEMAPSTRAQCTPLAAGSAGRMGPVLMRGARTRTLQPHVALRHGLRRHMYTKGIGEPEQNLVKKICKKILKKSCFYKVEPSKPSKPSKSGI